MLVNSATNTKLNFLNFALSAVTHTALFYIPQSLIYYSRNWAFLTTQKLAFTLLSLSFRLRHQNHPLCHLCSPTLSLFHHSISLPTSVCMKLFQHVIKGTVCLSSFLPLSEAQRWGKQRPHSSLPQITSSQHNAHSQTHKACTYRQSPWRW